MKTTELTVKEYAAVERVKVGTVKGWISNGFVSTTTDGLVVVPPPSITVADRRGYGWTWFSGVYFILCDGFVKIGYAQDVRLRLRALCVSNPKPLQPLGFIECGSSKEAKSIECSLHQRFDAIRERHEWFRAERDLLAWIKSNASLWPAPKRTGAQ